MNAVIIAEAGVNHNGDMGLARALIERAAEAGADWVKFQTFRADDLVTADAAKAGYQQSLTGAGESQRDMLRRLELPWSEHAGLIAHAATHGVGFLSTPFDLDSLRFLTADLGLGLIKLPSGELTNGPLLLAAARSGTRLILSTGMSSLGEIESALSILAFGMLEPTARPTALALRGAFASAEGQCLLAERITLLHCTTEYPAPPDSVNLRAMDTLAASFGLEVGLSDHTTGIAVALAAVARGARVIEKHFTLDRSLPGPDHQASLLPDELTALVAGIRTVELALGSPRKTITTAETGNALVARKSLVATRPIARGEAFNEGNLGVKRPGTGLSPLTYWDWLGRVATRDYTTDQAIEP